MRRLPWIVGLGVLAAVGAALLLWDGSSSGGRLPGSSSAFGQVAPVTPVSMAGRESGPGRFALAADSLRRSLEAYRRLQADFDGGRIDCAALTPGYRGVSERVLDLARERGGLGPGRTAVFDSLMSVAAEIDRQFDAAGCPRP